MPVNGPQPTNIVHGPQSLSGPNSPRIARGAQQPATPAADELDISPAAAQAADAASEVNTDGVRTDLVARIRSQIADGTYETTEKLDTAVDRLLDEIG